METWLFMQKNIGAKDRIIRFIIANFLFAVAIWQNSWIIGFLALFVLYESLASWCLFYQLFGKNSCSIKKNDKNKFN